MNKFLLVLLACTSFLYGERMSITFREPINSDDLQRIREAIERSKHGDRNRVGVVLKRSSLVIQGAREPLHSIALFLPLELERSGVDKLAFIMHLDNTIITREEAEKLVWEIKDISGQNWRIFRGTKMYTASDAPPFNPDDVYDSRGSFRQEIVDHFYALPISKDERDKTYELIDKMGTEPWYKLLFFYKSRMEKIGNDIDKVHPLRFTGVIFSDPHLKECMKEVKGFKMKWDRFYEGFASKMANNHSRRNVLPHLPGYCVETGADYNALRSLVESENWKGFLEYMIEHE